MNLVRDYDHLLGESWCIESHGSILGMFFGANARGRAQERMESIRLRDRAAPLERSLEARARLLEHLRGLDNKARSVRARQRATCRRRRRERG